MVIDETLVSCFPSADHDLAHIAMTPVQWFPNIIEWIYGEINGFSGFVAIIEDLGKWILPGEEVSIEFK